MPFWPTDIDSQEIASPNDILMQAATELTKRTRKLTAMIRESTLDDRVVLAFEVINTATLRTLNLFEVAHRVGIYYPLVINPPASDIPEFLKKKRFVAGTPSPFQRHEVVRALSGLSGTPGYYVDNEWVCSTPMEFSKKLTDLLSQDYIKAKVISLLADSSQEANDEGNEAENRKESDTETE